MVKKTAKAVGQAAVSRSAAYPLSLANIANSAKSTSRNRNANATSLAFRIEYRNFFGNVLKKLCKRKIPGYSAIRKLALYPGNLIFFGFYDRCVYIVKK